MRVDVPDFDVPIPNVPGAAGRADDRRAPVALQRDVRADPRCGGWIRIHLRRAVRVRRPPRHTAPRRRAGELGRRQAHRVPSISRSFRRRFAPRLRAGALLQRRTHPFFDEHADRTRVWGRTEWPILRDVHAGAEVAWQSSSLAGQEVDARSIGADVVVDTRVDPLMPHNAIFVRSAVERLHFLADEHGGQDRDRRERLCRRCTAESSWRFEPCAKTSAGRRRPSTNRCSAARAICAVFAPATPLATRSSRVGRAAHSDDVAAAHGEIRVQRLHGCRHDVRQGAALRAIRNWRRAWGPESGRPLRCSASASRLRAASGRASALTSARG